MKIIYLSIRFYLKTIFATEEEHHTFSCLYGFNQNPERCDIKI